MKLNGNCVSDTVLHRDRLTNMLIQYAGFALRLMQIVKFFQRVELREEAFNAIDEFGVAQTVKNHRGIAPILSRFRIVILILPRTMCQSNYQRWGSSAYDSIFLVNSAVSEQY